MRRWEKKEEVRDGSAKKEAEEKGSLIGKQAPQGRLY